VGLSGAGADDAGLSVTILGCDGSFAGPGGACSGYLVRGGGVRLWLDCGPGTLAGLQEHLDLDDLDGVVVTHAHPDHWVDLLPYHNVVRHIRKRVGVPVWSPARVRELAGAVNGRLGPAFDWTDVSGGSTVSTGGLTLTFSRTDHGPETLAVRVDAGGSSLAYTADTGPGWSLSELGPGIDLALCEASLPKEYERTVQHLSGRQAGQTAKAAGARRLVLTHIQPGIDREKQRADASAAFGGPVELAEAGVTYRVGT
jgi:ribonuclease BN (tRNA processing enzyme)